MPNPESIREEQNTLYKKWKSKELTFKPKLSEFIYVLDPDTKSKKKLKRPKSAKNLSNE